MAALLILFSWIFFIYLYISENTEEIQAAIKDSIERF